MVLAVDRRRRCRLRPPMMTDTWCCAPGDPRWARRARRGATDRAGGAGQGAAAAQAREGRAHRCAGRGAGRRAPARGVRRLACVS